MTRRKQFNSIQLVSVCLPNNWYVSGLELEKTEGVYTNRAMAFIKLAKYKEALYDCEQALVLNPKFAKAHMRSFTCYTSIGELQKALVAL